MGPPDPPRRDEPGRQLRLELALRLRRELHHAPIEGPLHCVLDDDGDPDTVAVDETGLSDVQLERTRNGVNWQALRTLPVERDRVVISFPKERKRGQVTYRLTVPGTESVTDVVTSEMTVKVKKKRKRR